MTAPLWFKAPFKILRLFVREKLRDRVYTVSLPQVSLLYFHSSIYLPFSTQTSANYFYYPLFCVFVSGLEQQLVAVERVKLGCAHPIIYGVDFFPLFFSLFCALFCCCYPLHTSSRTVRFRLECWPVNSRTRASDWAERARIHRKRASGVSLFCSVEQKREKKKKKIKGGGIVWVVGGVFFPSIWRFVWVYWFALHLDRKKRGKRSRKNRYNNVCLLCLVRCLLVDVALARGLAAERAGRQPQSGSRRLASLLLQIDDESRWGFVRHINRTQPTVSAFWDCHFWGGWSARRRGGTDQRSWTVLRRRRRRGGRGRNRRTRPVASRVCCSQAGKLPLSFPLFYLFPVRMKENQYDRKGKNIGVLL